MGGFSVRYKDGRFAASSRGNLAGCINGQQRWIIACVACIAVRNTVGFAFAELDRLYNRRQFGNIPCGVRGESLDAYIVVADSGCIKPAHRAV